MEPIDARKAAYTELGLLIEGQLFPESDAGGEDVLDPASGEVLARLPHAGPEALDKALSAASRAFPEWRAVSALDRGRVLRRAADLMRERLERIATVLTLEEGKTLPEARAEVTSAAEFFDWFADEGRRAYGRLIPARLGSVRQSVVQEPVGPVACFTPWNFPAVTPARKIAPALAAGCTCILKPAEETPGTALEIARCLLDAGLPPAALSVVYGVPATVSEHLLASPVIRKISFTGSTAVGKHLARLAAGEMKAYTMELGGHAPVLVCRDADPAAAAAVAGTGKFRNAGQVCIAPTRFFVEEPVYEAFVDHLARFAGERVVGDGLDDETTMGPLANARRVDAVRELVDDAVAKGARVVSGGTGGENRPGFFHSPTVIDAVPENARAMHTEPFGPVALVCPVADLDTAIARANALPYALAAYAFTESARSGQRIAREVEAGVIGINHLTVTIAETPFGGIKDSGTGREGGIEGLEAYTVCKYVTEMHAP